MRKIFLALVLFFGYCTSIQLNAQKLPNKITFYLKGTDSKYSLVQGDTYFYAAFNYANFISAAQVGTIEKNNDILDVVLDTNMKELIKTIDKIYEVEQAKQTAHLASFVEEELEISFAEKEIPRESSDEERDLDGEDSDEEECESDANINAVNDAIFRYHIVKALRFKCALLKPLIFIGVSAAALFGVHHAYSTMLAEVKPVQQVKTQSAQIAALIKTVNNLEYYSHFNHTNNNSLMTYCELQESYNRLNRLYRFKSAYKEVAKIYMKHCKKINRELKEELGTCSSNMKSYEKTIEELKNSNKKCKKCRKCKVHSGPPLQFV